MCFQNPGWGSKTYSEILREKQLKKLQPDAQTRDAGDSGDQTDRQTSDTNSNGTMSKKRCFSPVTFAAAAENDAKKHRFQPVVFDLEKESAAEVASLKRTAASPENSDDFPGKSEPNSDFAAKRKRSISPIKFGVSSASPKTVGDVVVAMDNAVTARNDVQKAVVTSSSDSPSEEAVMETVTETVMVTPPKAVTLRRSIDTPASRRKSSSDSSRRHSVASNRWAKTSCLLLCAGYLVLLFPTFFSYFFDKLLFIPYFYVFLDLPHTPFCFNFSIFSALCTFFSLSCAGCRVYLLFPTFSAISIHSYFFTTSYFHAPFYDESSLKFPCVWQVFCHKSSGSHY